jgi:hypothetical protein
MLLRFFQISFILVISLSSTVHAKNGYGVIPLWGREALLGVEPRKDTQTGTIKRVWSDCGGAEDPKDKSGVDTAYREGCEESAGVLKRYVTKAALQQAELNGHYVDHHHIPSGNSYRVYFVSVSGTKPSIQEFHKSAKKIKKRLGRHAHVEKEDWGYFDIQALLNTSQNNRIIPGTNAELYAPMNALMRNASAQQSLVNHLNSLQNLPAPAPAPKKKNPQVKKRSAPKVKKGHHIKKRTAYKRSKPRQRKRRR